MPLSRRSPRPWIEPALPVLAGRKRGDVLAAAPSETAATATTRRIPGGRIRLLLRLRSDDGFGGLRLGATCRSYGGCAFALHAGVGRSCSGAFSRNLRFDGVRSRLRRGGRLLALLPCRFRLRAEPLFDGARSMADVICRVCLWKQARQDARRGALGGRWLNGGSDELWSEEFLSLARKRIRNGPLRRMVGLQESRNHEIRASFGV